MRELIDDRDLGMTRDDRVDIHFRERDAAKSRALRATTSISPQLRLGVRACMRFHEPDDDVDAALPQLVRLGEHAIRLPDARGRPDVYLELSSSALALPAGESRRSGARAELCVVDTSCR